MLPQLKGGSAGRAELRMLNRNWATEPHSSVYPVVVSPDVLGALEMKAEQEVWVRFKTKIVSAKQQGEPMVPQLSLQKPTRCSGMRAWTCFPPRREVTLMDSAGFSHGILTWKHISPQCRLTVRVCVSATSMGHIKTHRKHFISVQMIKMDYAHVQLHVQNENIIYCKCVLTKI